MISYIPLTFFGIIGVVGLAFFVHGFVNRQKIYAAFSDLASTLSGHAGRSAIWAYPYLSGSYEGRPLKIFFHTSENHTVSVLNLVVELGLSSPDRLVLLQKDGFREPKPEAKTRLEEEVGDVVAIPGCTFDVRSKDPARAKELLSSEAFCRELSTFSPYNQILLWEGSLIAGKQFEGVPETMPQAMMETLGRLGKLARHFEGLAPKHSFGSSDGTGHSQSVRQGI